MAQNVYGNGANSSAGANTIVHYYDKAGVKSATEVNVYGQWADRKSMPQKMGKTFKISKFLHIYDRAANDGEFAAKGYLSSRSLDAVTLDLANNAALAEGAGAVNQVGITKITMETSLARYGEMIDYTDEVDLFSEDQIQVRYREELGLLANRRQEDLKQRDMLGTGNKLYANGSAAITDLGATIPLIDTNADLYKVGFDLIRQASKRLVRNRASMNTSIITGSTKVDTRTINKAYYGILGNEIKYDLETLTRGSGNSEEFAYIPAYKYAAASNLAEGEVGAMHNVRFVESESAMVRTGAGAIASGWYGTEADNTTLVVTVKYVTEALAIAGQAGNAAFEAPYVGELAHTVTADTGDVTTRFDVFPILFPTKGSFATVGLNGRGKIKFNASSPAKISNENPYGTKGFFSYNFWYAGIILDETKLLEVDVLATA